MLRLVVLCAGFCAAATGFSRPASASHPAATPAGPLDAHTLEKRAAPMMKALKLKDPQQVILVQEALDGYFQALAAWHDRNDGRLAGLWSHWAGARTPPDADETKAAGIGAEIDELYATFRPRHDQFVIELRSVLSADQVEAVKDALTKVPGMGRTYKAFLRIVPAMDERQRAFVLGRLLVAREQAMDAVTKKEKIDLFKRRKVEVQQYIDAQGYDWKKSYAAFVAGLKTESAKKAGRDAK